MLSQMMHLVLPSPCAQVQYWEIFQPLLRHYDRIWLLDEDLSFYQFDYEGFLHTVYTAFPAGVPVIAQPVFYQYKLNGKQYKDHHLGVFDANKKLKHPFHWINADGSIPVAAAQTGFIEIQVCAAKMRWS